MSLGGNVTAAKGQHETGSRPPLSQRAGSYWIYITLLILLWDFAPVYPHIPPASSSDLFPLPPSLRPHVEFWKKVFATYSEDQVVIHDGHYMKIYKVIDLRPYRKQGLDDAAIARLKKQHIPRETEEVRRLLLKLHRMGSKPQNPSSQERHIWNLLRHVQERSRFLKAANHLRAQSGLKERFAEGIQISRRYLDEMEAIFRQEGLPVELTRLPLVESCFNLKAYSRAHAAGIWQFIPSTGRLFLRIDGIVDERWDPLLSTRAAAKLLRKNYEALGTWPLAITAYNHGLGGMERAVRTLGTRDLTTILRHYQSPSFGFASKNFYAEFLAALEVEGRYQDFFGDLPLHPPLRYDTVRLEDFVSLKTLARLAGTTPEEILALNPALRKPIRSGRAYVPKGYLLRIPKGSAPTFTQRYAALPQHHKASRQKRVFIAHRVRRGQTLSHIARYYGTTVVALKQLNGIRDARRLRAGQKLRVPVNHQPKDQKPAFLTHTVRRGQTLGHIAKRYGTTVTELKRLNGIRNVRRLQIGQRLLIPSI